MALATRYLTVTRGNLNNNHLYLTEILDLFPPDSIGGTSSARPAARSLLVLCDHETISTDITGDKNIFRQRAWLGRFFRDHDVRPGDLIRFEQLEPYVYRVSAVGDEPADGPLPAPAAARTTGTTDAPGAVLDHDPDKVEDAALALLYLNLFHGPDGTRASLVHPQDVIDRLRRKGYLGPSGAGSPTAPVTPAGLARAEALFREWFGRSPG